jgi:hypothetical protein
VEYLLKNGKAKELWIEPLDQKGVNIMVRMDPLKQIITSTALTKRTPRSSRKYTPCLLVPAALTPPIQMLTKDAELQR